MPHSLQVLLLLALAVAAAKLAGTLATRIGQPSVFGEILVGLLLGPTVLDILAWPVFLPADSASGPPTSLAALMRDLSDLGVLLLMFVAGLETDLGEMRRVGKVAFWSATGGVLLPLIGGAATAVAFGFPLYWDGIFIGTILTATSVSISAQTLLEIGAFRSREGATILGAAVIDDVMGIVLLSVVVALAKASASGVDPMEIGRVALRLVVFFGLALAAAPGLRAVLAWASRLPVSQAMLLRVGRHRDVLRMGGGICRTGRGNHRRVHRRRADRADRVQERDRRWRASVGVFDLRAGVLHRHRVTGQRS